MKKFAAPLTLAFACIAYGLVVVCEFYFAAQVQGETRGARQSQGALMIRSFTVIALMCMTSGETATAFDLKETLKDLMPCKYAAIRLCERPQQVSAAALWKCGATLAAAPQEEIGKRCVAVLKRYGAALN
jgi:hypothetical protein